MLSNIRYHTMLSNRISRLWLLLFSVWLICSITAVSHEVEHSLLSDNNCQLCINHLTPKPIIPSTSFQLAIEVQKITIPNAVNHTVDYIVTTIVGIRAPPQSY